MKKSVVHIFRMGTIGLLLALVCSSCTYLNKLDKLIFWDKGYYVHQVKWEGETLSIVAKWYTGSLNNWKAIIKANPSLDPYRIVIGNDIRIPDSLLITRDPMPKSFLAGFDLEKKSKLPTPQAEPVIKPVPADMGEKPVLPEKISPPLTAPTPQPGKKPVPAETSRPAEPTDNLQPAAPSDQPKAEKKPTQPKAEQPLEKKEPPLFGPRGYSN